MQVDHMRYMPKDIFLSMSDEVKIRMLNNQLYIVVEDEEDYTYQDVFTWLCTNSENPFYIISESKSDSTRVWIYFYEELDVVAFKLRWM